MLVADAAWWNGVVFLLAMLADRFLGEPPAWCHPVVAMGTVIGWGRRLARRMPAWWKLLVGGALIVVGVAASFCVGRWLESLDGSFSVWLAIPLGAFLLKTTFAAHALFDAGRQVDEALSDDDLPEARRLLGYHLVSRPTDTLTASQTSAATIESLAENVSDSVVAPIFWYLVAGLGGALAYRFVNTADAMLGYRDPEREWLGKIPARLDDVLNGIPARLSALAILVVARFSGGDAGRGLRVWWRDAAKTDSPNAGQPMSAAAGVLGRRLDKVGHYVLGAEFAECRREDIPRALRLIEHATILTLGVASLVLLGVAALSFGPWLAP
ncbi:cobalamin biosynthesis protein [Planctomycetes bacterium Pan216]|uniref:Cobalamin biosynthesis protein CobD n=1 Tax=Kolteria novifilia TaxID=2527975 RepID=A0A518B8M1_9BACT|nr:cobalamin biosynthesis protein [Planctomycetes bacterium Pan216]